MIVSFHFALFCLRLTRDLVSCVTRDLHAETVPVALGDDVTLNCTYNCSAGFVRGCWSRSPDSSGCLGTWSQSHLCTVSLHLPNVSADDVKYNYWCYTEATDHPQLQQHTRHRVSLHLLAPTTSQTWTVTPTRGTKNVSVPGNPAPAGGGFSGIQVVAAVMVLVALILAALAVYLFLKRSRRGWNGKGESAPSSSGSPPPSHHVLTPVNDLPLSENERVTLRVPTPDHERDSDVPYADILIAVRGASTPTLTRVGYLAAGAQKEFPWRDDGPRSHLWISRSADRLHVPPNQEISRKMSTGSEYAVLTYA